MRLFRQLFQVLAVVTSWYMSMFEGYDLAALLALLLERGILVNRNSVGSDKLHEATSASTLLASMRSLRAFVCLVTALVSARSSFSRRRRCGISIASITSRSAIVGTKSSGMASDVATKKLSMDLGSALSMQCES